VDHDEKSGKKAKNWKRRTKQRVVIEPELCAPNIRTTEAHGGGQGMQGRGGGLDTWHPTISEGGGDSWGEKKQEG